MIDYDTIIKQKPYNLDHSAKHAFLTRTLVDLTQHHYQCCEEYKKILDTFGIALDQVRSYYDLPFLPVRVFKEYDLKSIENHQVIKTMTSSGTTGQQVSRISLDRQTSMNQTKVLTSIVSDYIGSARMPMIIIDSSSIMNNRTSFSARVAGIQGFSIFARDRIFALDEKMNIDVNGLQSFLEKHKGERILLFGFTFMIWQYFYKALEGMQFRPDLSEGVLIHGGGWKKLADQAVSPEEFRKALYDICRINCVYDYYGMVEQTGSIYMECECHHLHTPIYSDVIIRRPMDFSVAEKGERGIVEVVSVLPYSYPGHILLTEDEGQILGEDDCPCGRKGKYFKVFGRLENTEIRGCSDTYDKRS